MHCSPSLAVESRLSDQPPRIYAGVRPTSLRGGPGGRQAPTGVRLSNRTSCWCPACVFTLDGADADRRRLPRPGARCLRAHRGSVPGGTSSGLKGTQHSVEGSKQSPQAQRCHTGLRGGHHAQPIPRPLWASEGPWLRTGKHSGPVPQRDSCSRRWGSTECAAGREAPRRAHVPAGSRPCHRRMSTHTCMHKHVCAHRHTQGHTCTRARTRRTGGSPQTRGHHRVPARRFSALLRVWDCGEFIFCLIYAFAFWPQGASVTKTKPEQGSLLRAHRCSSQLPVAVAVAEGRGEGGGHGQEQPPTSQVPL